ncbi:MAG TPA: ATP-binding cassette domain-containing protein [Candidatus Eremiobacteraceae bacterium]|nr:ATP-binding cassette domain-containing protein [Candidatus Eremiobacteraceae bacterium]
MIQHMDNGQIDTPAEPPQADVAIRLQCVEMRYGQKIVLSDCSIDCKRGEITCVIGLSGAGKSSILRVINGLRRVHRGHVFINNVETTRLNERSLIEIRKKMGFAFQYSALFDSLTVGENVAYPLYEHTTLSREEIRARVDQTLEALGLEGVDKKMPSEMSGGMQKRVGFARAVVNDPEIILFDEPTTGLDPIMTHVITDTIKGMQTKLKATCVVVSHDMPSVYAIADNIAMLFEGTIIDYGPVSRIKASKNPIVQQFLEGSEVGPIPI